MTQEFYTRFSHAPELNPNLILGSFQFLGWLFFHPSAWCNHIRRINPELSPKFSLIALTRTDWANPVLHRLLLIGYVIWPLLIGILTGLTLWVFGELETTIATRIGFTIAIFILIGGAISVTSNFGCGVASGLASGIVVGLTGNFVVGIVLGLGVGFLQIMRIGWLSALLYPLFLAWNTLLYYLDQRQLEDYPALLPWHSAFWDEYQRLPLFGLENHLVLIAERRPVEGQAAIDHLAAGPQRRATQAAQIELEARRLERCEDIEAIGQVHFDLVMSDLTGPANNLLRLFGRHSRDIQTALNHNSSYYRHQELRQIEQRLGKVQRELTLSNEVYAVRFYLAATRWYQILTDHLDTLNKTAEIKKEISNPYVVGNPLDKHQEIFVGRRDIVTRIEQLLLGQQRPPLLLYGQRRMGKTSLLNNLVKLLPSTIVPLYVDAELISSANDYPGFLYALAKEIIRSAKAYNLTLPDLTHIDLSVNPFTTFNEWLDTIEQTLNGTGHEVALLALDEFEALENVSNKDRFDEYDILRMLRHLIQHRPRFKLLLAGSHTLDEFRHWAGYLINFQVIKISYLEQNEVRKLVEKPIKGFALQYETEASQRVLHLTRGHPLLVQSLCFEIVTLKNKHPLSARSTVCVGDVEAAALNAVTHSAFFFEDIENQITKSGRNLLYFLASQGEKAIVDRETLVHHIGSDDQLSQVLALLEKRDLIQAVNGTYCFQVELIRRWFEQLGRLS